MKIAITVAIAAPSTPYAFIGPNPNMKMKFSKVLVTTEISPVIRVIFAFPVHRKIAEMDIENNFGINPKAVIKR